MAIICYYGDRLSPNMAKTPEGYLICKNVPIARTGYQTYLESELIEDGSPTERVNVYRSPDEVFSQATLASFEGKPVCDGHPCVDVTPDNYKVYSKGHVQHVRIGKGDDADKILADLYITDKDLIDEIQNGKREVSAGYYAEDKEDSSGRICQTKIRGNHVAVVDEGRAGRSVCIRDTAKDINSQSINKIGGLIMKMDRAKLDHKRKVASLVARYLRDAEPEELEERIKDAAEVLNEEISDGGEDVAVEEEVTDACKDEEPKDMDIWKAIDEISARLDAIEERFHDEEPKEDEEPDDLPLADEGEEGDGAEIIGDEDEDVDASEDVEDEDVDVIPTDEVEARLSTSDAAIREISRAALKIKNADDRKRVQDAIIRMASKGRKSQIGGIMNAVRKNQKSKKDSSGKSFDVGALQAMYDKLNPHKGNK